MVPLSGNANEEAPSGESAPYRIHDRMRSFTIRKSNGVLQRVLTNDEVEVLPKSSVIEPLRKEFWQFKYVAVEGMRISLEEGDLVNNGNGNCRLLLGGNGVLVPSFEDRHFLWLYNEIKRDAEGKQGVERARTFVQSLHSKMSYDDNRKYDPDTHEFWRFSELMMLLGDAIRDRRGVCIHYAGTLDMLFKKDKPNQQEGNEIHSAFAGGHFVEKGKTYGHAWNVVTIGDKTFVADATNNKLEEITPDVEKEYKERLVVAYRKNGDRVRATA
jgi:hypothetical protein